jgi:1,4-dihydroxy-2-naphthoate octaprenyltransferase
VDPAATLDAAPAAPAQTSAPPADPPRPAIPAVPAAPGPAEVPAAAGAVSSDPPPARWRAFARLAKLDVYDYYLSVPLVLAMAVPVLEHHAGRALGTVALLLLGEIALCAAMVAFDDVTGLRDGSDAANYGPDAPARRLARKPLLAGHLTEPQAIRFGWLAVAGCVACWAPAVLVAPARPGWALVGAGVCLAVTFQYSWWLRISYNGFQEVFLAALGWAFVLVPLGLLTGHASGFAGLRAVLFGLGPLLFGVYSNTNDIAGDRAVGRRTVAATATPPDNRAIIAPLSALEAVLPAGAALLGLAPWWFVPVMAPVTVLRGRQFALGFGRGDVLGARRLGIRTHRVATVLLVAASLGAALLPGGAA